MKKIWVLLVLLLVSCSNETSESISSKVLIENEVVESTLVDNDVYVIIEALEALDIDVLEAEDHVVFLSKKGDYDQRSNNRSYNWYIDQGNTGTYANDNCGPSASVMAAKWQKPSLEFTAQEARGEFRSSGGWWYTDDIEDFFDKHKIDYEVDGYDGSYELISTIESGDIILLCIDTTYIEERDDDTTIGRFYSYAGGHFVVVKGYLYINRELYFEVYDSNCWGETYSDGSPKGKNRLYSAKDVDQAIETWWDNYFIIKEIN